MPLESKDPNRLWSNLLTRTAIAFGVLTVFGSCVVGFLAYKTSRNLIFENIYRNNLNLARSISSFGQVLTRSEDPQNLAGRLTILWDSLEPRFSGSYLCVVGSDGRLLNHTAHPNQTGAQVGQLKIEPRADAGPTTVRDLIAAKRDWVGQTRNLAGERQMIAFAYNRSLDGLIAVHVPTTELEADVRRAAMPWGLAIGFLAVIVLPVALFLMHKTYGRAQQTTTRSDARLRAILNTAVDAVITIDAHGVIESFNPAAEKVFGYPADEVVGQNVKMLMPEPYRSEHDMYIANYLRSGQANIIGIGREIEAVHKDGTIFPMEVAISEFRVTDRRMFAGMIRDITDRKNVEQERLNYQQRLRSMTSELILTEGQQRRQLATDLHDQVGQSLAIAKIKLGQLRQATAATELAGPVNEVRDLIEGTIQSTRSLTFELGSPVLYELGLEAALETLAEDMEQQHGVRCELENDGHDKPMKEELSLMLFRSVRELLINVVKHAQATLVKISIEEDGHDIKIGVEDDGVGFKVQQARFHSSREGGFGLFAVAERLDHLGGRLEVKSTPGHGTRATLYAPLGADAANADGRVT